MYIYTYTFSYTWHALYTFTHMAYIRIYIYMCIYMYMYTYTFLYKWHALHTFTHMASHIILIDKHRITRMYICMYTIMCVYIT